MKNYEIYIDGKQVEIDDKFDFSLLFKSSVFTELTSVQSNRTTTIKLPKTIENLKAIEFSNLPENDTVFPYRTKAVEVYKNGMPIIQNGKGYVLTISDSIEFCIIWGVDVDIKQLQNLKLRSLQGDESIEFDDRKNFIFRPDYRYGFALSQWMKLDDDFSSITRRLNTHPFVSLKWIIEKIIEKSEINIVIPDNIQEPFNQLCIPLLDINIGNKGFINVATFNFYSNFRLLLINIIPGYTSISNNGINILSDCKIAFDGIMSYIHEFSQYRCYTVFSIFVNNTLSYVKTFTFEPNESGIILNQNDTVMDCKKDDVITFTLSVTYTVSSPHGGQISRPQTNPIFVSGTGAILVKVNPQTAIDFGSDYPIIPNLPDISAYELLNTMKAMFGLFGNYTKDGITLFSIDDFYTNKSKAPNWTGKVITGKSIDTLSFSVGDFAQKNWLKYAEDETVNTNADAYLKSDNDHLDSEKDIYQMKFASTDNTDIQIINQSGITFQGKVAYFPFYTYDLVNEKLNTNKLSNRIVAIIDDENEIEPYAIFSQDLFFEFIIQNFYSSYQQIIYHPKLIEVQFLLTDLDIFQLDMMIPVYLEQTGNYYIIQELTVSTNNIAKAKLIQM